MTNTKSPLPSRQRAMGIIKALGTDLAALAGAMMIVHGIDQIHRPSAFIIGGAIALAASVLAARRSA